MRHPVQECTSYWKITKEVQVSPIIILSDYCQLTSTEQILYWSQLCVINIIIYYLCAGKSCDIIKCIYDIFQVKWRQSSASVPEIDSLEEITVQVNEEKDRIVRKTTNVRELIYGSNFNSVHKVFFFNSLL